VLTTPLNTTATSFTVVTAAKFVANELVTIDNEQISVCSIVGSTMNVGHSSCPNVDGRGFNHTAAAGHNAGAIVSAFITAWNFNSTTAEIKSIESVLGPNMTNLAAVVSTLNPNLYNFAAVKPSTPLIAGNTTVTFPVVPIGMNGSDYLHNVYVSGGTGPSEACAITGGTGTSGQVNGQMILNCPNAHSGPYAINSASAGFAEAWTLGPFLAPTAGTYNFYAPTTPPNVGSVNCGAAYSYGTAGVQLKYNALTGSMFNVVFDGFSMSGGCMLSQVGTPTSSIGIHTCGGGCSGNPALANNWSINDVSISKFYQGLYVDGGGGNGQADNLIVAGSVLDNITLGGGQGHFVDIITVAAGQHGIEYVNNSTHTGNGGVWFGGVQTFGNGGWGIHAAQSGFWLGGHLSYLNNDYSGGLYINGYGGQINHVTIQYEGMPYSGAPWATNTAAIGIELDSSATNINITDVLFFQNQGRCLYIGGTQNRLVNVNALSCGVGGNTSQSNNFAAHFPISGQLNTMIGSQVGSTQITQNNLTLVANQFNQNSATLPTVQINASTGMNLVGNIIIQGGSNYAVVCGNNAQIAEAGNIVSGTTSGLCQRALASAPLTPGFLYKTAMANIVAGIPGLQAGIELYITDGTPNSAPCTGSGTGAIAVFTGTQFNCH
jgi:hypothetical protein